MKNLVAPGNRASVNVEPWKELCKYERIYVFIPVGCRMQATFKDAIVQSISQLFTYLFS